MRLDTFYKWLKISCIYNRTVIFSHIYSIYILVHNSSEDYKIITINIHLQHNYLRITQCSVVTNTFVNGRIVLE